MWKHSRALSNVQIGNSMPENIQPLWYKHKAEIGPLISCKQITQDIYTFTLWQYKQKCSQKCDIKYIIHLHIKSTHGHTHLHTSSPSAAHSVEMAQKNWKCQTIHHCPLETASVMLIFLLFSICHVKSIFWVLMCHVLLKLKSLVVYRLYTRVIHETSRLDVSKLYSKNIINHSINRMQVLPPNRFGCYSI